MCLLRLPCLATSALQCCAHCFVDDKTLHICCSPFAAAGPAVLELAGRLAFNLPPHRTSAFEELSQQLWGLAAQPHDNSITIATAAAAVGAWADSGNAASPHSPFRFVCLMTFSSFVHQLILGEHGHTCSYSHAGYMLPCVLSWPGRSVAPSVHHYVPHCHDLLLFLQV